MTNAQQRIGDPDRERARAALERHAADGRLTLDELSDRLGVVYAAVTDSDLAHALHGLPPLPSATDIVESIRKLGGLYHRGALRRREFVERKAELLTGLVLIAEDEVDHALDELTSLYHQGLLSGREYTAAKAHLLPYV